MSATQVTGILFQLQQLDLELDHVAAEQQTITTSLQGNAKLRKLRAESDTAQQQLHSGLQAQKEAEWTLEDLDRRIKEQERRLYSGTINNAKELQALQQEVQRLRAQQSRQEDVLLQVIDGAEALSEEAEHKLTILKQSEDAWQQEVKQLEGRRDQLDTHKQELHAQRQHLMTAINEEYLKRYEAMRRSKQGRAVSKIEQNSCQWCRVILTPSEMQRVRISSELQTCSNCGRILYYDR